MYKLLIVIHLVIMPADHCLPGSVLLTLLSGFNRRPISLLALSPLRHWKDHTNHTHSLVVFLKHGRRLMGTGGPVPPKLEGGDGSW